MPVLEAKGRTEQQSSVGKLQEMLTSKPDPAAALCYCSATGTDWTVKDEKKNMFQSQLLLNQTFYLKFDRIILSYH